MIYSLEITHMLFDKMLLVIQNGKWNKKKKTVMNFNLFEHT